MLLSTRFILPLLLLFYSCSGTAQEATAAKKQKKKKNILFLMSDEHSGKVMGCAGDKIVQTPNIDALAKSGVIFRNTYCQNPVCVPARASLVTGMMPSKIGVFGNELHSNKTVLSEYPHTMARVFSKAGYKVEWVGKEHWASTDNAGVGFGSKNENVQAAIKAKCGTYMSESRDVGRLPQDAATYGRDTFPTRLQVLANSALSWLDRHSDDTKPFFMGVSIYIPHFPFFADKSAYNLYKDVITVPRVSEKMINDLPSVERNKREKYKFAEMTEAQTKKARAVYYAMVTQVDYQVGRFVSKLKELGLDQDTIVVYTSDHGELAGEHGLWYKTSFYEDSVRVPLMISDPTLLPSNRVVWSPVQSIDIAPTLYDLCNINTPSQLDGRSLMPIIDFKENGWFRRVYSENYSNRHLPSRMIREGKYKYCWHKDAESQLFNLKWDPAEEHNLINKTKLASRIKRMHRLVMKDYLDPPSKRRLGEWSFPKEKCTKTQGENALELKNCLPGSIVGDRTDGGGNVPA